MYKLYVTDSLITGNFIESIVEGCEWYLMITKYPKVIFLNPEQNISSQLSMFKI